MWKLRHKSYHSTHLSRIVEWSLPFISNGGVSNLFFLLTPLIIYMIFCIWESEVLSINTTGLKWKFICNPSPPHYMYITSVDVVSFPLKSQLLINSNLFCSVVGDIGIHFRKWSVAPETIYVYILYIIWKHIVHD